MNVKIKYGFIALFIIIIQSIIKLIGVLITGSLSFLSETIDTIVDIFFVALTLYSIYISQKPADYEHMYGHAKIDSIGALIQGIVLITIYIILIFNAIQIIITQNFIIQNPTIGLELLIISIAINLIFSLILIWQGKKRNSLSLKIQGLNLFQDSLRAIIVVVNFVIVIFFEIVFLDPIFSIIVSSIIIISAINLSKEGINDLTDVNPIDPLLIEEIKKKIFNLEHVNGVMDLKIRALRNKLFLQVILRVEDHISIIHADEITKKIRILVRDYLPKYDVETIVEMNPISGEKSLGENIINLVYSSLANYPKILDIDDLNIFRFENKYFLSFKIIVERSLTLNRAHKIITKFENELKQHIDNISRVISHIEPERKEENSKLNGKLCKKLEPEELEELKEKVEKILRSKKYVEGYHGFEFWNINNYCIIELHVFFDGKLNISKVHEYISELEMIIHEELELTNLKDVILHSEPKIGRTDGNIFKEN